MRAAAAVAGNWWRVRAQVAYISKDLTNDGRAVRETRERDESDESDERVTRDSFTRCL